jgi:hypothetical protein
MLSRYKVIVRGAEYTALSGAVLMLGTTGAIRAHLVSKSIAGLFFWPALLFVLLTFPTAIILGGEFTNARSMERPPWERNYELSPKEVAALVRWAPLSHRVAAVLGLGLMGLLLFTTWGQEKFLDSPLLFPASLMLLSLPVLSSAARMYGTYQDDFTLATAAKARLLSRNAYLAYRREGGENLLPSGRLILKIRQALASSFPSEGKSLSNDVHLTFGRYVAVAAIERLIADPEWTSHHVFLAILKAIVSGSRDRSLADHPALTYDESAELILLIELLEAKAEE